MQTPFQPCIAAFFKSSEAPQRRPGIVAGASCARPSTERLAPCLHASAQTKKCLLLIFSAFQLLTISAFALTASWNPTTQTVIYRSKRHHNTKRNFEIFKATDFLAAVIDHIPPKGQQTVRYYGLYSNKSRGLTSPIPTRLVSPPEDSRPGCQGKQASPPVESAPEILLIPPPPKQSARDMRPLWRALIIKLTWPQNLAHFTLKSV